MERGWHGEAVTEDCVLQSKTYEVKMQSSVWPCGDGKVWRKTMNEKKTGSWSMIIGGIALIIVLFIGVQVIFWVLEEVIHQDAPAVSAVQSVPDTGAEAPGFCVHCGEELQIGRAHV